MTWLGRIVILIILGSAIWLFTHTIHEFLAPVEPVKTGVMVLEGFVNDLSVEEAFKVFQDENYKLMLITGKKRMKGSHLDFYKNDGTYTAATLDSLGMDMAKLVVVEMDEDIFKDRTYYSAVAVNNWIQKNHPEITSLNLITLGCHGRRSHYLFEKALGDEIKVGIISLPNQGFNADKWWRSSYGFRQVMQETIAWVYAKFFFFPTS